MTLDTRARRAAQGIHRAVEVMEMSTSTKGPGNVERFDRFRDRKQRNRRIGALLVAAMIAIAAIIATTNALERSDTEIPVTPPSQSGRIVFGEGDRHGVTRVYTMNPDGTDVRALAPSGYVTYPDGSLQPITTSTTVESECMSWTPDGSRILIDVQAINGLGLGSGLATINADGTGYTELPLQEIGCGALSPDGTRFVAERRGPTKGIYTVRASDGGDLVRLTNFEGTDASFSPDGTQVVFTPINDSGLWVVNADSTGLRLIAHNLTVRPTWSPDGRWILFETDGTAFDIVHPDGSGLQRNAGVGSGAAGGVLPVMVPRRDSLPVRWHRRRGALR
jgi:hypothetical protein